MYTYMVNVAQLENHLKNFAVKELKKEVVNVKKGFQVSKLKRAEVEAVILLNYQNFIHLFEKTKVKKTKPSTKKTKNTIADDPKSFVGIIPKGRLPSN